eukprot:PhM_4_TR10040/c2_g1_i7/m.99223
MLWALEHGPAATPDLGYVFMSRGLRETATAMLRRSAMCNGQRLYPENSQSAAEMPRIVIIFGGVAAGLALVFLGVSCARASKFASTYEHAPRDTAVPIAFVCINIPLGSTLRACHPTFMSRAQGVIKTAIDRCCEEHVGYQVRLTPFSALLAFGDVDNAVAFGVAIHERLLEQEWGDGLDVVEATYCSVLSHLRLSEQRRDATTAHLWRGVLFQVGINYGVCPDTTFHALVRGYTYKGPVVKAAIAVAAAAQPGQTLVTSAVWSATKYSTTDANDGTRVVIERRGDVDLSTSESVATYQVCTPRLRDRDFGFVAGCFALAVDASCKEGATTVSTDGEGKAEPELESEMERLVPPQSSKEDHQSEHHAISESKNGGSDFDAITHERLRLLIHPLGARDRRRFLRLLCARWGVCGPRSTLLLDSLSAASSEDYTSSATTTPKSIGDNPLQLPLPPLTLVGTDNDKDGKSKTNKGGRATVLPADAAVDELCRAVVQKICVFQQVSHIKSKEGDEELAVDTQHTNSDDNNSKVEEKERVTEEQQGSTTAANAGEGAGAAEEGDCGGNRETLGGVELPLGSAAVETNVTPTASGSTTITTRNDAYSPTT